MEVRITVDEEEVVIREGGTADGIDLVEVDDCVALGRADAIGAGTDTGLSAASPVVGELADFE